MRISDWSVDVCSSDLLTRDAQAKAEEEVLDLVEVSPNAEPPVCKIMDYGKYLYQKDKASHAAKKKQKQIQIKEIKFRPTTEDGDYQTKLRSITRFLDEGDKVRSEEHTSELQSLMRISYAVFCLKKTN